MNQQLEQKRPTQPRRKRKHRPGAGITATLVLASCVLALSALVLSGRAVPFPRTLEAAVVDALNERIDLGDVEIQDVTLGIIDGTKPRLRLRDVAFNGPEGGRLAELNEVLIDVSVGALLQGRVRAERVSVNGAQITLRRAADGQFRFGVPSEAQTDQSLSIGGVLEQIDRALGKSVLTAVGDIEAVDVVITLEDARSGRLWQATNARLSLRENDNGLSLSVASDVFNGTDDLAEVQFSFAFDTETRDTTVGVRLSDVPAQDLALQSPVLGWLGVLRAPISGAVRASVDGEGHLNSLDGTLDIAEGSIQPDNIVEPVAFDTAKAYFTFDPERSRIDFNEIGIGSEMLSVAASGHAYIGDEGAAWSNSFFGQFEVDEVAFLSDAIFPAEVSVDRLRADLKLTLSPFSVSFAEVLIEDGDVDVHADGKLEIDEGRWRLKLDSTSEAIGKDLVLAFWPLGVASKTRRWLHENLMDGRLENVAFGVRFLSGAKPDLSLSFNFFDTELRYLDGFPIVRDGRGQAELHDRTFTLEVEEGWVNAPGGGVLDGAGTVFSVRDVREKPAQASLSLSAQGELAPILEVIDLPPLELMSKAGRESDIAQADVSVQAEIDLPLKRGLGAQDVDYNIEAYAAALASDQLVPGRSLTAEDVHFRADKEGLKIGGAGRLDGLPFETAWRTSFSPETTNTSSASGRATLSMETLSALGVALPDWLMAGETEAVYELSLPEAAPPTLAISSNLRGASLQIPALGWRKSAVEEGRLDLEIALGEKPDVRKLELTAPGISLEGDVEIGDGDAFRSLSLDQLRVGRWLDVSALVEPSGKSAVPRLALRGGRLDLRELPDLTGAGANSTTSEPISIALDSVRLTDRVALSPFRGSLTPVAGGLNGNFEARLAGRTSVRGSLVPAFGGSSVSVQSDDAGGALRDVGLTSSGRDGSLSLKLTPIRGAPKGHYDGTFSIENMRLENAPVLASLLDAISVIGLIDELEGSGIRFDVIDGAFRVTPERVTLTRLAGIGPSLGISAEGVYDPVTKELDMQGVVSPIYFLNVIGSVLTRRGEGLFGFNYRLTGSTASPEISVNPLSILTPGMFREIFRSPIPAE